SAPQVGLNVGQAEYTAAHDEQEYRQHDDPQQYQPFSPEYAPAAGDKGGHHDGGSHQRAPLLRVGITAKENEPEFFGNDSPAGGLVIQIAACEEVGHKDGVGNSPAVKLGQKP